MPRSTERQTELKKLFSALAPQSPFADAQPILEAVMAKKFKALPPSIALWLAVVAHIRHRHTDYDKLLEEGYDRDSARHFTRGAINDVLGRWGCSRKLDENEEA